MYSEEETITSMDRTRKVTDRQGQPRIDKESEEETKAVKDSEGQRKKYSIKRQGRGEKDKQGQ